MTEKENKQKDESTEQTLQEENNLDESNEQKTQQDVIDDETSMNMDEENEQQTLEAQVAELEERVLRLQAEIANIQRRNTKERQDAAKYRSQSLATTLLDALDNLYRALDTEVKSDDAIALHKGLEMVLEQFSRAFEEENIKAIDPMGEPFDPNFHQAVSMIPGEEGQESQTIVQVLQKGYVLNDRVIRPAMVIVSE